MDLQRGLRIAAVIVFALALFGVSFGLNMTVLGLLLLAAGLI